MVKFHLKIIFGDFFSWLEGQLLSIYLLSEKEGKGNEYVETYIFVLTFFFLAVFK